MTQAILRPNEFIICVEEDEEEFIIRIRNPHVDRGQENTYDLSGLHYLNSFLKAAAKLRKQRSNPLATDESNPKHNPG